MIKKDDLKEVLKEISDRNGGLSPQVVVKEAEPETSPIHDNFEWDNSKAAQEYRLWQARQLIVSVTITKDDREVQQYINVTISNNDGDNRLYVPIERVMSDETLHKQALQFALDEIKYWRKKYHTFTELKNVVNDEEIQKVERDL